jgi:hypothetical protein
MTQIRNCARCQGDHELIFTELKGEPIEAIEGNFTHYAMCPTTRQPIVQMKNAQIQSPEFLKRRMEEDLLKYGIFYTYKGYRLDPTFIIVKRSTPSDEQLLPVAEMKIPVDEVDPPAPPGNEPSFSKELESLINKHSMENPSGTPDFILAEYMMSCLRAYEKATEQRNAWFK